MNPKGNKYQQKCVQMCAANYQCAIKQGNMICLYGTNLKEDYRQHQKKHEKSLKQNIACVSRNYEFFKSTTCEIQNGKKMHKLTPVRSELYTNLSAAKINRNAAAAAAAAAASSLSSLGSPEYLDTEHIEIEGRF